MNGWLKDQAPLDVEVKSLARTCVHARPHSHCLTLLVASLLAYLQRLRRTPAEVLRGFWISGLREVLCEIDIR